MKKIEIELPSGKKAEWQEIDGKTVLVMVDEKDNRPVTERIKTFEDACKELGIDAEEWLEENDDEKDILAYKKLRIIAKALNEGWKPKFVEGEHFYIPWLYLYTQEEIDKMDEDEKRDVYRLDGTSSAASSCGLAYAPSSDVWSLSAANVSARLALKSNWLAFYCGKQFIDIWADYLMR